MKAKKTKPINKATLKKKIKKMAEEKTERKKVTGLQNGVHFILEFITILKKNIQNFDEHEHLNCVWGGSRGLSKGLNSTEC